MYPPPPKKNYLVASGGSLYVGVNYICSANWMEHVQGKRWQKEEEDSHEMHGEMRRKGFLSEDTQYSAKKLKKIRTDKGQGIVNRANKMKILV